MRLGFRQIKGFHVVHGQRIVETRKRVSRFTSIEHFHRVTRLPRHSMVRLAEADAFGSLGLSRREALWEVMALSDEHNPLFDSVESSPIEANLPIMPLGQEVMTDYSTTSLSLKRHPLTLVRDILQKDRIITAAELENTPHGRWVRVAGLVLIRQRPGTASGIVFVTLEDETGVANVIVTPQLFDKNRSVLVDHPFLLIEGTLQNQDNVISVKAKRIRPLTLKVAAAAPSHDFH